MTCQIQVHLHRQISYPQTQFRCRSKAFGLVQPTENIVNLKSVTSLKDFLHQS